MRITSVLLLMLYTLFISSALAANTPPIPNTFSVKYSLMNGPFKIGETKRSLSLQENGSYLFESYTIPAGMAAIFIKGDVTERSIWKYQGKRARPIQYSYKDTNKKNKRDVNITFNWDSLAVTNNINGEPWDMKIKPDTQDKLLYQINLMLILLENEKAESLNFSIADGGSLKEYNAKVHKQELIETPAGKFEAVRIFREDNKSITTLWCAPSLKYLPVRIEHKKKGGTRINAYLVKVDGLP